MKNLRQRLDDPVTFQWATAGMTPNPLRAPWLTGRLKLKLLTKYVQRLEASPDGAETRQEPPSLYHMCKIRHWLPEPGSKKATLTQT